MKDNTFSRFCIIGTGINDEFSIKHYTSRTEYIKELDKMYSVFNDEKGINLEYERLKKKYKKKLQKEGILKKLSRYIKQLLVSTREMQKGA